MKFITSLMTIFITVQTETLIPVEVNWTSPSENCAPGYHQNSTSCLYFKINQSDSLKSLVEKAHQKHSITNEERPILSPVHILLRSTKIQRKLEDNIAEKPKFHQNISTIIHESKIQRSHNKNYSLNSRNYKEIQAQNQKRNAKYTPEELDVLKGKNINHEYKRQRVDETSMRTSEEEEFHVNKPFMKYDLVTSKNPNEHFFEVIPKSNNTLKDISSIRLNLNPQIVNLRHHNVFPQNASKVGTHNILKFQNNATEQSSDVPELNSKHLVKAHFSKVPLINQSERINIIENSEHSLNRDSRHTFITMPRLCVPGYYKDKNGTCIPYSDDKCPPGMRRTISGVCKKVYINRPQKIDVDLIVLSFGIREMLKKIEVSEDLKKTTYYSQNAEIPQQTDEINMPIVLKDTNLCKSSYLKDKNGKCVHVSSWIRQIKDTEM